jgi:hypothetical protein
MLKKTASGVLSSEESLTYPLRYVSGSCSAYGLAGSFLSILQDCSLCALLIAQTATAAARALFPS